MVTNDTLRKKLTELPKTPGVYFHKDLNGKVIYIGKAARLNNRVRQYFQKSRLRDPKTDALVAEIHDVDWIEVETELDALFLEAELIRRYQPPYNILLRDDKSLSFVRIDINSDHPTVNLVRRPLDDGAEYFGPYYSAFTVKKALKYLRRVFPFDWRKPVQSQRRASLDYHIGLSPGLEQQKTSLADYRSNLRQLMRYLKGERKMIMQALEADMKRAAKAQEFEQAALIRNKLNALHSLHKQIVFSDREFMDLSKDAGLMELAQLLGLYEDSDPQHPQKLDSNEAQGGGEQSSEAYEKYGDRDAEPTTQRFVEKSSEISGSARKQVRQVKLLRRIEGYDISHMSGTDTVASMVVFCNGIPDKAAYRKFKMRLPGNDDFAHMHEVITRRLSEKNRKAWQLPGLFLIDGGKGQLAAAIKGFEELGVTIPAIGLAKQQEQIVVSKAWQVVKPDFAFAKKLRATIEETDDFYLINVPHESHLIKLLQRIRDESHRFAVSYHSVLKVNRQRVSLLDEIPTIGPLTKKKLLRTFGSLRGIQQARDFELEKILGQKKATILIQYLRAEKKQL